MAVALPSSPASAGVPDRPARCDVIGEERTDAVVLRPPVGDHGGVVRVRREPGFDLAAARGVELSVDIGVQVFFVDGAGIGHYFGLRRVTIFCSASTSRSRSRARERRDMTVPTGTPSMSATS